MLTNSDIEDLQQKYLTMDLQMNNKSEIRQGPAFRALVRGLDETNGMYVLYFDRLLLLTLIISRYN